MALTVVAAAHRVLLSAALRGVLLGLAPKIIALFAMAWALVGMMKRDDRS
jgi:hypothetical protein